MKTVVDYLIKNKTYEEEIAGYEIKLKLVGEYIVMYVDDYPEYLIEIDGEVSVETEIQIILEDKFGANIRFCEICGIPYDMGFIAGDGDWYCCQSCFKDAMDKDYGKDGWRASEYEGEYGGFNELCYVLRMDKENDYNISLVENGVWGVCIPSVRDFFIPVKDLAKKIVEVELDEEDYGFDGICLTVHVED